jgi:hypothetical protein
MENSSLTLVICPAGLLYPEADDNPAQAAENATQAA